MALKIGFLSKPRKSRTPLPKSAYPDCAVCGVPIERVRRRYKDNTPCHTRCRPNLFVKNYNQDGTCRKCGKAIPSGAARGGHFAHCGGKGKPPPNWHLRPDAAEIQSRASAALSKALVGKPQPWHSERMRLNNPSKLDHVRKKASERWLPGGIMERAGHAAFGRGSGGKGSAGTESEARAWKLLKKLGFSREAVFGIPAKERPSCANAKNYFADFLSADKKLIVEIDGSSHIGADRQASNRRKDAFFSRRGIVVIRIPATFEASELLRAVSAT